MLLQYEHEFETDMSAGSVLEWVEMMHLFSRGARYLPVADTRADVRRLRPKLAFWMGGGPSPDLEIAAREEGQKTRVSLKAYPGSFYRGFFALFVGFTSVFFVICLLITLTSDETSFGLLGMGISACMCLFSYALMRFCIQPMTRDLFRQIERAINGNTTYGRKKD